MSSIDDFAAWLEAHEPDAVVGTIHRSHVRSRWRVNTSGVRIEQDWGQIWGDALSRLAYPEMPITAHDALLTLMEVTP